MIVNRKNFILVTEDHGGFQAGKCVVCGAHGWLDQLNHKTGCPVDTDVEKLFITTFSTHKTNKVQYLTCNCNGTNSQTTRDCPIHEIKY